jgi:hypothetical protein
MQSGKTGISKLISSFIFLSEHHSHIYLVYCFYSILLHVSSVYFIRHEVKILVHKKSQINTIKIKD